MSETKLVEALVSGGQATAGPPLGPALGPLGLNVLAVVNKINELTASYAGMKVPVKVEVDLNTKQFNVTVGIPTTSALIVRQLGIAKGSGKPNAEKVGDLSMA
jgi:large subunit ribosomal protein L11